MKYEVQLKAAIQQYWEIRTRQAGRQMESGNRDQGARSAVTGGMQMSGFEELATSIALKAGIPSSCIFTDSRLELPGYYRPEKKWDFLVVKDESLICALEFKSQVGPSFGNNFNNRTEEAIGTATDLWVAFREQAFGSKVRPFLGYFFLLEKCAKSTTAVSVKEPHFKVFPEFKSASYYDRYCAFLTKLKLERLYDSVGIVLSKNGENVFEFNPSANPNDLFCDLEGHLNRHAKRSS